MYKRLSAYVSLTSTFIYSFVILFVLVLFWKRRNKINLNYFKAYSRFISVNSDISADSTGQLQLFLHDQLRLWFVIKLVRIHSALCMIKFISPPGSVVEKQPKIGFIFSLRFLFIYF